MFFQFSFFVISIVILQRFDLNYVHTNGENFKQITSAIATTTSLCISESVFLDLQADRVKEDSSCALIVLGSSHGCGRKDIVPKCGIGLNNCKLTSYSNVKMGNRLLYPFLMGGNYKVF